MALRFIIEGENPKVLSPFERVNLADIKKFPKYINSQSFSLIEP